MIYRSTGDEEREGIKSADSSPVAMLSSVIQRGNTAEGETSVKQRSQKRKKSTKPRSRLRRSTVTNQEARFVRQRVASNEFDPYQSFLESVVPVDVRDHVIIVSIVMEKCYCFGCLQVLC